MLTAKEALKITDENRDKDLERVLEMIKEEALEGRDYLYLPYYLNPDETKLKELGYETSDTNFGLYCCWSNPDE